MTLPIDNKVIIFLYRRSRTFFTANGGFLYLCLFSLPTGRRGWGWRGISESSLSRYLPTHTDAKGEDLKSHKSFCIFLRLHIQGTWKNTLRVTPTAKRNSVRVARLVGQLPRVACFARTPGLGNRNSYRVAAACGESNCGINPLIATSVI